MPMSAVLSDSVPPLVKMTSSGLLGADAGGDRLARLLERAVGVAAQRVEASSALPNRSREERQHRLEHARVHGGGRCVVEVDGVHVLASP